MNVRRTYKLNQSFNLSLINVYESNYEDEKDQMYHWTRDWVIT